MNTNNWNYYDSFKRIIPSGPGYKKVCISKYLNEEKQQATGISEGKTCQAKDTVSAKALRQECALRNSG